MFSLDGVDWAVNGDGEILLALEFASLLAIPEVFIVVNRAGYLVFDSSEVANVAIPEEILVSVVAAADILIVSLRGGAVLAEKRVPVSHA